MKKSAMTCCGILLPIGLVIAFTAIMNPDCPFWIRVAVAILSLAAIPPLCTLFIVIVDAINFAIDHSFDYPNRNTDVLGSGNNDETSPSETTAEINRLEGRY